MQSEIQLKFNEVDHALHILKKHIDWENAIDKLNKINLLIEDPNFWNETSNAQLIMRDKKNLEKTIDVIKSIEIEKNGLVELIDLAEEESDQDFIDSSVLQLNELVKKCDKLQLESLLSGEADANNCYIEIHAGAGGTESCDWVEMLMRMYIMWGEKNGYKITTLTEDYKFGYTKGIFIDDYIVNAAPSICSTKNNIVSMRKNYVFLGGCLVRRLKIFSDYQQVNLVDEE